MLARPADDPTVRPLLTVDQQELLTVYTDGFRAYDPPDEDDVITHKYATIAMENTLTVTSTSTPTTTTRC